MLKKFIAELNLILKVSDIVFTVHAGKSKLVEPNREISCCNEFPGRTQYWQLEWNKQWTVDGNVAAIELWAISCS